MGKYKAKVISNELKTKKIKNKAILSEEQLEVRRFIRIVIVTLLLVVACYCCSVLLVNKRKQESVSNNETQIQYDNITVGMILNRPYDEYYVMVYDTTKPTASYYNSIAINYLHNENAKKVYTCDLSNSLNASFVAENNSNPKAKNIEELSFGEITLLHIKNSVITEYIEDVTSIENILK